MIDLTKWPGLLVVGENVTPEQAQKILIRTDTHMFNYQCASNDYNLNDELCEIISLDKDLPFDEYWEEVRKLRKRYNCLDDLYYLRNDRIASTWVGGPKGWCNWDGTIGCNVYNIGKWPEYKDLLEEWQLIAKEFPFLDLTCQITDRENSMALEDGECNPVLQFEIKEGLVKVKTSELKLIIEPEDYPIAMLSASLSNHPRDWESGISVEELKKHLEEW